MTAKEASAIIGMKYDSLTEILRKYEGVRDWLSPVREKGIWVYAEDSLPKFTYIAERHAAGISLSSIAASVGQMAVCQTPDDQIATVPGNGHLVSAVGQIPAPIGQLSMTDDQIDLFAQLVKAVLPPPDDALLTMKAAHAEHGIPLHVLASLRVKIGRRWFVKRSAVLKWIQEIEA